MKEKKIQDLYVVSLKEDMINLENRDNKHRKKFCK